MHLTFGNHPQPLGCPCAKSHFCRTPTAELARAEKSDTQSLNHSPSLFDTLETEAFVLKKQTLFTSYLKCIKKSKIHNFSENIEKAKHFTNLQIASNTAVLSTQTPTFY